MRTESNAVRFTAVILAFLLSFAAFAHAADTPMVATLLGEWQDSARGNRTIPYKIYYAPAATGARPVVIFSHGLGGNREGSEFLLSYLAQHGYIAVAVQHPGSDTPAIFGDVRDPSAQPIDRDGINAKVKDAMSPGAALDRFKDIPFAITMLSEMNAHDAMLGGHLDMQRLGMSGHSYGAVTTQALVGQRFMMGMTFSDPRIKAGIIYSPSKPRRGDAESAFADVRIPTFHMTGTEDRSPIAQADMSPEERLQPYQAIHTADKYLLVLTGGDHMVFSGRDPRSDPNPKYPRFHELVQRASLAFWDAYLLNKSEAKAYLAGGGFARDLGSDGHFEFQLR